MNKGKYVFSQLLSFLDPFVFLRISKKYGGDKYVKTFSCWNQLAVRTRWFYRTYFILIVILYNN